MQSQRFLELGFRMLTEGEPQEKLSRLSSPQPHPPDSTHGGSQQGPHYPRHYQSDNASEQSRPPSGAPDMPAFPDRGGPSLGHPYPEAGRYAADLDLSSESHEGSNLSGNEGSGGKYSDKSFARKQREFIPENRKDELYWEKRRKNNEAARRSREKRRMHDMVLENRIVSLEQDNSRLRHELNLLKKHYRLPLDRPFEDHDGSGPDSVRASPSPPPSVKAGNIGAASFVSRDPSPLLAASTSGVPAAMIQQPGILSSQASRLSSYFMPGAGNPHDMGLKQHESAVLPSAAHHRAPDDRIYDMRVKHEPEEDNPSHCVPGTTSTSVSKREPTYEEEGYSRSRPVSPPGAGGLSASATAAAAAAYYAATGGGSTFPARHGYHFYGAHSWQRSPLSSHSSDEASDEPLQLTVHKRSSEDDSRDGDSFREGFGGDSSGSRYSNGPASPPSSSLPLKLRHKMPTEVSTPPNSSYSAAAVAALAMGGGAVYGSPFTNGLAQLSEIALQASPLSLVKKDSNGCLGSSRSNGVHNVRAPVDPKYLDPKYLERRRRNNEAARKCRENRKNLTRMREVKSDILESENNKLRSELDELQEEMKKLRDLLEKKRLEQGLSEQDGNNAIQHNAFSKEQQRRLEELEQEHRKLELEQKRLEERRERHRLQEQQYGREDSFYDLNDDDTADDSKDAD